jgi:signal transduction histidine kinase
MLSIPGLKEFIKSRDSKNQHAPVTSEFFRPLGDTWEFDLKAYVRHLAVGLGIELLALVEVGQEAGTVSITAAGRKGLACDMILPDPKNGGALAALIRQARTAAGSARLFVQGEVFPGEGAWCDLLPMDATVAYFFVPLDCLPVGRGSADRGGQPTRRFVLTTSEETSDDSSELALKTAAAASLITLSLAPAKAPDEIETLASLKHFLGREGYAFCLVDQAGAVTDQSGDLLEEIGSEAVTAMTRSAASLAETEEAEVTSPNDVTPETMGDVTAMAYPISTADGTRACLVIVKRSQADPPVNRHNDRLGLLSRFMSSIAHEIKNPLTGIAAGVQYLSRKLQPGATEDDTIEFVLAEINRLNRIVDDLYKIAKPPELVLGTTSVNDVVGRSLLSLSEEMLRKRLHVEQDLDKDIPEITADGDRLQQILINIIKNAVEASSEKGVIRVETLMQDTRVVVRVTDYGSGIAEEDRDRIFEPFYSTKPKGTGLGLCISQRIIDQHGGRIYIEASPDGGTVFVIELPLGG